MISDLLNNKRGWWLIIDWIYQAIGSFFGYILFWLTSIFQNYGLAVITFAIITKVITIPFIVIQIKNNKKTKLLQSKQQEIRDKYKDAENKDELNKELTQMYIDNKYNPVSGCIMQILMFFVLVGVFFAIASPVTSTLHISQDKVTAACKVVGDDCQYKEIGLLEEISKGKDYSEYFTNEELTEIKKFSSSFDFFGFNLFSIPIKSGFPVMFLPILSFLIPFLNMNISSLTSNLKKRKTDPNTSLFDVKTIILSIVGPALTFSIALFVPCAIIVYWITSSILGVIQTIITKKIC